MKKIIYSLVIMIAAGSLFTSCIEQEEPSGVYELRVAKKTYLESLGQAKLIYANAEKAKAEAAAAYDQARAAVQQADAQAKQIQNQLDEINNKVADALAQRAIDSLNALKEKFAADAQKANLEAKAALAKAEADYKNAIDSLAAVAYLVAPEVQAVIDSATIAYTEALGAEQIAQKNLWVADSTLYRFNQYADENKKWSDNNRYPSIEYYQAQIADAQKAIDEYTALTEKVKAFQSENEWAALLKEYKDKVAAAQSVANDVEAEKAAYHIKSFIDDSIAFKAKVDEYIDNAPAVPAAIKYGKLAEKFEFELTGGKDVSGSFPTALETYLNEISNNYWTFDKNTLKVTINENTDARFIDSILNQTSGQNLNSVIAALKRDSVIKANPTVNTTLENSIKTLKSKDSTANAMFQSDYDTLRNFYSKAKDQFKDDTTAVSTAAQAVAKAINDYKAHKNAATPTLAKADTTALFDALVKYGKATSEKMQVQDTIKFTAADNLGNFKVKAIPLADIKVEDIAIICNGTEWSSVYGVKNSNANIKEKPLEDPLLRIINTLFRGTATVTEATGKASWTPGYQIDNLGRGYSFRTSDDSITVAHFALIDTMRAQNHGFANSTAQTKWNTIIARFFGTTAANVKTYQTEYDDAIKNINWSAATFDGLIEFVPNNSDWSIKYTRELAEVVKEITNYTGSIDNMNYQGFFNTQFAKGILTNLEDSEYTELADMYRYKPQIAAKEKEFKGDDKEILDGLEALADTLAKVRAPFIEADSTETARFTADTTAYAAYANALTGGEANYSSNMLVRNLYEVAMGEVQTIFEAKKDDLVGWYTGLQKDWFTEIFADCYAIIKDWNKRATAATGDITYNQQFVNEITPIYEAAETKFKTETEGWPTTWAVDQFEQIAENAIETLKGNIKTYEKAIADIEAGYEPYNVMKAILEGNVAECEAALEAAKAETALKKAAFDAIIAQYAK